MYNDQAFLVAVAGNIGTGKTSLTTLLAQSFNWKAFYEIVETNPYLADFYADMPRWSFQTQVFFLTKRFRHLQEILRSKTPVIQDRSIFEDAEVFAKNLYLCGQMDERDFKTYNEHFQVMAEYIKAPDLLVYLKSDTESLLKKIELRGRKYELTIPTEYVAKLNEQYESWAASYQHGPIVTIDVSRKDFVNRPEDLQQLKAIVKWELECLQNKHQTPLPFVNSRASMNLAADVPQQLSP